MTIDKTVVNDIYRLFTKQPLRYDSFYQRGEILICDNEFSINIDYNNASLCTYHDLTSLGLGTAFRPDRSHAKKYHKFGDQR